MQEKTNLKGIVKWFSSEKGYGFIGCDEIKNDIFVHFSDIQMKGYKSLNENDEVLFDYDEEMQKALNVRKITEESNVENDTDSE
ncbi:MAG: cold shock domain-containing protein [Bacilli bacterium]|nr:cold shock domain-containing protein [Bacilli bacterium]